MRVFGSDLRLDTLRHVNVGRVVRHTLGSLWRIYLMLVLAALIGQRWLIYPAPKPVVRPLSAKLELIRIPRKTGDSIHAYYLPAAGARVVVLFHGNGEQLASGVWFAEELARRGLSVFAVEYPGYGLSSQQSISEGAIYGDAERAIRFLQSSRGIRIENTILLGQSLGTAVAAEMAVRRLGSRLILVSPFTSMVDMARKTAPFLPVSWLVCDRFDTLTKASRLALPTLLVHGTSDTVVPTAMGLALAQKLPAVTLRLIDGADHNDVYDIGGDALLRQIADFAEL